DVHGVAVRGDRDRMGSRPAVTGAPIRAVRVIPEAAVELEMLASVGRFPYRDRFAAGPDHVGTIRGIGLELPHPLQRRLGVDAESNRTMIRLDPGFAEVVGMNHRRSPVLGPDADQDSGPTAPRVDG